MKHTKSVADVDRSPQPPQLNSFAFPNVAAPLALETGDVDEVIVDMWWERDAIQCCREISRTGGQFAMISLLSTCLYKVF